MLRTAWGDWLAPALVGATLALPLARVLAEDSPVPSDFKIIAEFGAGFSDWKSWDVTITGEGRVIQKYSDQKEVKKSSLLSKTETRALWVKVNEASFFKLQPRYSYPVTDCETLILTITANKVTHRVSVYAPSFLADNKDVKRFGSVWSEVLRKVPSPYPNQKP